MIICFFDISALAFVMDETLQLIVTSQLFVWKTEWRLSLYQNISIIFLHYSYI